MLIPSASRAAAILVATSPLWRRLKTPLAPRNARLRVFWQTTRTGVIVARRDFVPSCALLSSRNVLMGESPSMRMGSTALSSMERKTVRPPSSEPAVSKWLPASATMASANPKAWAFWTGRQPVPTTPRYAPSVWRSTASLSGMGVPGIVWMGSSPTSQARPAATIASAAVMSPSTWVPSPCHGTPRALVYAMVSTLAGIAASCSSCPAGGAVRMPPRARRSPDRATPGWPPRSGGRARCPGWPRRRAPARPGPRRSRPP